MTFFKAVFVEWIYNLSINSEQKQSSVFLHPFHILMQLHHLIMKLLHSYLLFYIYSCGKTDTVILFSCCLSVTCLLIVIVYKTVLYELLPEFSHTLGVFRSRTISKDACSSFGFGDLSLWKNINIRLIGWLIAWEISTLDQ